MISTHNIFAEFSEIMLASRVGTSAKDELTRLQQHPGPLHRADYLAAVLFLKHDPAKERLIKLVIERSTRAALADMWDCLHERRPTAAGDRRPVSAAEFVVSFAPTARFFSAVVEAGLPVKGAVSAAVASRIPACLATALGLKAALPYDDETGGPGTPRAVYGAELDRALYNLAANPGRAVKAAESMSEALMRAGANPGLPLGPRGTTAFLRAISSKNTVVAEAIAAGGYSATTLVEATNQTAFHLAVSADQFNAGELRLLDLAQRVDGKSINRVDSVGDTALVTYIHRGAGLSAIRRLLDLGADAGWYLTTSPLAAAMSRGVHERITLATMLLLAGAPRTNHSGVDIIDKSGDQAMIAATDHLRGHVLARCCAAGPVGDAAAATRFIQRRGGHDYTGPASIRVVKDARRGWAPSRHRLTTPSHRSVVTTVLLVAKRCPEWLPPEMWHTILSFTVHDAGRVDPLVPGVLQTSTMAQLWRGHRAWGTETAQGVELLAKRVDLFNTTLVHGPDAAMIDEYHDMLVKECVARIMAFSHRAAQAKSVAAWVFWEVAEGRFRMIVERVEAAASGRSALLRRSTPAYSRMRRAAKNAEEALADFPDHPERLHRVTRGLPRPPRAVSPRHGGVKAAC